MRIIKGSIKFFVSGVLAFFFVTACSSQEPAIQSASAGEAPASPFYTGDGGKDISIAILVPRAVRLEKNEDYLPALVQGEFVSNFSGYSAISVLDRQRLQEQYDERFSGYYDDDAEAGLDWGHLPPTDYIMGGSITRTGTGYTLQIQITKTDGKMTAASYSQPCTFVELDNLTGVRRASLDLLQEMGVTPTQRTRTELTRAAATNHVSAQTALAQGITAQRQGTEVAALSYYYQAAAFDPTLLEAVSRVNVLSANISSGNIGADARGDIQWRRDWVARLTETERYFENFFKTSSPPFAFCYSTELERGQINYQTETLPLSFKVNLHSYPTWFVSVEKALQAVYDGLNRTGKKQDWGLSGWPGTSVTNPNPFSQKRKDYTLVFELVNDRRQVIGKQSLTLGNSWSFYGGSAISLSYNENNFQTVTFNAVKADDITNTLTIRIASVNGVNPQAASQIGSLRLAAVNSNEWASNITFSKYSQGIIGRMERMSGALTIPPAIWGEPVIGIAAGAFRENQLTSVVIPNSVIAIGDSAFASNQLTSVVIPDSLTIIGDSVFRGNRLTSLVIPDSVIAIGDNAFRENQLTELAIGKGVTSIALNAFVHNRLTRISIPGNVSSVTVDDYFKDTGGSTAGFRWGAWSGGPAPNLVDMLLYEGFVADYERNGRKAGTYILDNSIFAIKKSWVLASSQ
ncbi:MAG: leucine-rich repeat domain-containing protein [Spirochaetales bacterium]|jgi:hypothetical protein|nr:leucine-rich repeat domain-containing protein [Spirochaetales bacterium]